MTRTNAREIAFKAIFAYITSKENFNLDNTIDLAKKDEELDDASYEFIQTIVNSFVEHFEDTKTLIENHSGEFVYSRIYKVDLALLFLALTEIQHLETPVKVAVNEVLNLSKTFSTDDSARYINGVLANCLKDLGKQ